MTSPRHVIPLVALLAGTVMATGRDAASPARAADADATETRLSGYHYLSADDHNLYMRAFALGKRGDRKGALVLADQGHDVVARRILQWAYVLDRNSGASFAEIDSFLKNYPDWPLRQSLYARAESAIPPEMSAAQIVAWFGDRTPASSLGRIKFGEALAASGNISKGRAEIQTAWIEGSFEAADELAITRRDTQYLSPNAEKQRLDNLLWRDDISAAKRQVARVDGATQKLAQARIALKSGGAAATKALDNVSGSQADDPSLMFARAQAARRSGNSKSAQSLLQAIPVRRLPAAHVSRWWGEVNLDAHQAFQDGNPQIAYALVSDTGLSSGVEFADAEFFAGWLALRYLKNPQDALKHFSKLDAGVSRPISKARASYWMARAYEAMGDLPHAYAQYKLAANVPETFYGQVALTRIEATPVLHIPETQADTAAAKSDFEKEDLVRAMRVLADLGEEGTLRTFATRASELFDQARQQKLLMELVVDLGYREIAVRLAKAASYNDMTMLDFTHPVIPLPAYRGPGKAPDAALVLGLIRQETEFDPNAVSSAGARGIMQLMPSTARVAARTAGVSYRPNDLATDPNYAIQLGTVELGGLLQDWSGSMVLAAAAYNAGPNNARKWVALNGDPRDPSVDPIDWIEAIPFTETRNYVQRILENTQVYRNRLAGTDQPLQLLADLYAPSQPTMKVLNYKPPSASASAPPSNTAIPKARP